MASGRTCHHSLEYYGPFDILSFYMQDDRTMLVPHNGSNRVGA